MQKVYVGIDVGAVSVKLAVVDPLGKIIHCESCRTLGRPVDVTSKLLEQLKSLDLSTEGVFATGTGANLLKFPVQNEFKALVKAVTIFHPNVRTIFEMGGESSKFIAINNGQITDYGINGDCAAGTGSFIDQQAERLHYKIEDIGGLVTCAKKCARVAGRCSVFAKSDMIHAQQKGYAPAEVLKGLCVAVARNFKATIVKGRDIKSKVIFIGGLALNTGVSEAIREVFELSATDLIIPKNAEMMTAIGAALLAKESSRTVAVARLETVDVKRLTSVDRSPCDVSSRATVHPLTTQNVRFLRDRVKPYTFPERGKVNAYLGIDIGSVSTNFVVIDEKGDLILEIYTYTKARPIEVVTKGLKDIELEIGDKVNICGVGTTGSGRELIGELIGADVIKDEITAHKTGAIHICKKMTGEKVDTIFEIGGQDAKFIKIENGIVTDFTMNEACAAGTGSFLEEQAGRLGISIKQEFAKLALSSENPVSLGERCTVFMERDVNSYQLKGFSIEDIVAGLAYSVATNYLNRVVRGRKVGEHIFFQGGTAYNDAVAAAFSQILGKTITVPPHNGVIGAVGVALLAREACSRVAVARLETADVKRLTSVDRSPYDVSSRAIDHPLTKFRGYSICHVNYTMREFACNACTNSCDIQEFNVEGEKTYWGDKCSSRFRKKARTGNVPVIEDLIKERERLLNGNGSSVTRLETANVNRLTSANRSTRNDSSRATDKRSTQPVIGIPKSMFYFDRFLFWREYFETLGFKVITSDNTNKTISHDSLELTVAEPCYPIKLVHGHVKNLIEKGVSYIFLPNVISGECRSTHDDSSRATVQRELIPYLCPWHQTLPFVVRAVPLFENVKFLTPTLQFELGEEFVAGCLSQVCKDLKISKKESDNALAAAYQTQSIFNKELEKLGRNALSVLEKTGEDGIVLVGRPYNIYDAGANLNVTIKLREFYGLNIIPIDLLPLDEIDITDVANNMFWDYGQKIIAAAKFVAERPNLHMVYITNFKCGPDSFIKHFSSWCADKPYLTLQFDEHANDAGTITRVEAYLESKGLIKANNQMSVIPAKAGIQSFQQPLDSSAAADGNDII